MPRQRATPAPEQGPAIALLTRPGDSGADYTTTRPLSALVTTIRVAKRHRYTSIDRGTLNDRRLSYRARGILAYLLDKPDDWRTNADAIAAAGKEGRDAVRSALAELEALGYLIRRKWRDGGGKWLSEWTVLERPEGTEPGRISSAGYPPRFPRPQVLNTETENCLSETSVADPFAAEDWLREERSEDLTYAEWIARSEQSG